MVGPLLLVVGGFLLGGAWAFGRQGRAAPTVLLAVAALACVVGGALRW